MNLAFYQYKVSRAFKFISTCQHNNFSYLGPKSRHILSKVSKQDFSNEVFPPNSAAIIRIQGQNGEEYRVRALRVSFVGELGYELHIPKESCPQVYNILMKAGGTIGLKNAGYRSMYSLSSEKGS